MIFFFKQKTAYEMRISDWSSDVCSSDLIAAAPAGTPDHLVAQAIREHPAMVGGTRRDVTRLARAIPDRKSVVSGKSVSVRVDIGCRRIINKKQPTHFTPHVLTSSSLTSLLFPIHNSSSISFLTIF